MQFTFYVVGERKRFHNFGFVTAFSAENVWREDLELWW